MSKATAAFDYLAKPKGFEPQPVCVVFGGESFLKRQVIGQLRQAIFGSGEEDYSLSSFEGRRAALADVLGELSTVAMFGGGKRLVVVDQADDFVSKYRSELEDYVARPASTGVLILEVKTWPSNTRLAKAVAFAIDCGSPPPARLTRWLGTWAKQSHGVRLAPTVAEMLVETVGAELGLLDQELAKLASAASADGADKTITPESVQQLVGTWRSRTAWEMLDAALGGKTGEAMLLLDRLLLAGENPIAILGQISASLRRFAAATQLVLQAESLGRRVVLREVLQQAGIRPFVLKKAENQLRSLGRRRGDQLYGWLIEADLDLKGASAIPPRLILERLIVRVSANENR